MKKKAVRTLIRYDSQYKLNMDIEIAINEMFDKGFTLVSCNITSNSNKFGYEYGVILMFEESDFIINE